MLTKRRWMMGMVLGCICLPAPAPAQDAEDNNPPEEARVEKLGEQDQQAGRRAETRRRWLEQRDRISRQATGPKTLNLDRLEKSMKRDLNLDAAQIEKIEPLFQERREEYKRELAEQPKRMKELNERMSELLGQMREARRRGDGKAEKELGMEALDLQEQVRVTQITDDFLAALQGYLHEDQMEAFLKLAAGGRSRASLQEAARQRPELLRRFLVNLDLDDYRRGRVEGLYRKVLEGMRTGKLNRQERLELANEFYGQVMEVLSVEQKALLIKHLGGDSRRAGEAGKPLPEPRRRAVGAEQGQESGKSDAGEQVEYRR